MLAPSFWRELPLDLWCRTVTHARCPWQRPQGLFTVFRNSACFSSEHADRACLGTDIHPLLHPPPPSSRCLSTLSSLPSAGVLCPLAFIWRPWWSFLPICPSLCWRVSPGDSSSAHLPQLMPLFPRPRARKREVRQGAAEATGPFQKLLLKGEQEEPAVSQVHRHPPGGCS